MCKKLNFPSLSISILTFCLTCASFATAKIPEAVGFWRFEGNTTDSGRGHNNGTLQGTAALVNDSERGKCLELDGNGYVNISSGVAELGSADFTIAAWIKTAKIGVPILSKCNGNGEWEENEKELYVADSATSEGQLDGTVEYVGFGCEWIRGEKRIDDRKWHHVAITWDSGGEEGLVYIDGVEATDDIGFLGLSDNSGDTVRIGFSESAHSSGHFVGRIDDMAIFNVVLTPEQVIELMGFTGGFASEATKTSTVNKDEPITLDTDPNLVCWWKFDDASGKTASDSSRFGRKGTLNGDLSFDKDSAPGRIRKALKLDGENDYIEIVKYKGVTGTRPRTVAAWIKTTTSRGQIISWGLDDYGKMFLFCFIRGRIGMTPNGGYLYINTEVHDDKWHHIAAVVQDVELPNLHDDVKLYKDGTLAEIHDIGLLDLWPIDTGSDLDVRIGRQFKGLIDDVRLYDRALSENEIKALFELQSSRPLSKSR